MAILSALIFMVIAGQFTFGALSTDQLKTSDQLKTPSTLGDSILSYWKNRLTKPGSTPKTAATQNGNERLVSQNLQNLPMANIVGPKSCPYYHVASVDGQNQRYMKKLWIVARIVPTGKSTYADHSAACGLRNFEVGECKCLRYYLNFEKDETITIETMSLHIGLQSYRFSKNRLIFIDKNTDVFQGQHIYSAVIDAKNFKASLTMSPSREELFTEYEPFSLLGTDNYQTYAVYAACTHNTETPLAWVAFAEKAYINGIPAQSVNEALAILKNNGISMQSMVSVDQKKCLQFNV